MFWTGLPCRTGGSPTRATSARCSARVPGPRAWHESRRTAASSSRSRSKPRGSASRRRRPAGRDRCAVRRAPRNGRFARCDQALALLGSREHELQHDVVGQQDVGRVVQDASRSSRFSWPVYRAKRDRGSGLAEELLQLRHAGCWPERSSGRRRWPSRACPEPSRRTRSTIGNDVGQRLAGAGAGREHVGLTAARSQWRRSGGGGKDLAPDGSAGLRVRKIFRHRGCSHPRRRARRSCPRSRRSG